MQEHTLNESFFLDINITADNSSLSNSSFESNGSMTSPGYRMYLLPTLPGWVSTLYLVMLCLTIGLGIPGNLITALAYFFVKAKTSCDWYIFFVALFDLVSCVFRVTGYLLEFLDLWAMLTNSIYCMFVAWVSQTSVCVSIFIFGLISVERYVKICCAATFNFTAPKSKNICLVISAVTFVMGFPTVFMYSNTANGICTVSADTTRETWVKAYYCFIFALFIALTIAVMVCYIAIVLTVRKTRRTVGVFTESTMNHETPSSRKNALRQSISLKRSISKNISTTEVDTNSEAVSDAPPRWAIPGSCNNGTGCPMASRHAISKLFIVPGPQTRVIVQQIHTEEPTAGSATSNKQIRFESDTITKCSHSHQSSGVGTEDSPKHTSSLPSPTPPTPSNYSPRNSCQGKNMLSQIQYARRQRRDYKITGLLFLVTTIFIMSWIPPYYATVKAFFIGYTFPLSTSEYVTLKLAPTSYMINNFSNPIIYLALSSTYRKKVKDLWTLIVRFIKKPCRGIT